MKKLFLLLGVFMVFSGCSISEDCIKSAGTQQIKQIQVAAFDKIFVYPGISLVVKQGPEFTVNVKAGANFIDDIKVSLSGDALTLKDESGCNWVRDYGNTTVYVTAPTLTEIYSNTGEPIRSDGVLTYPILRLFAMDNFGGVGTNDFIMEIDNSQLVIASNNVAGFYITGQSQQMLLNFYDGIGRFEGANFLVDDIVVFQRGSNDMIVHPLQSISGNIYSTGDIICTFQPAVIDVIEHYTGRLRFQ